MTETVTQDPGQEVQAGGSARQGRPRPQETLERDEQVRALLREGPKTTAQLAEQLGIDSGIAYLCIHRLKKRQEVLKVQSEDGGRRPAWKLREA